MQSDWPYPLLITWVYNDNQVIFCLFQFSKNNLPALCFFSNWYIRLKSVKMFHTYIQLF